MGFLKNRTVLGIICIVLSLIICFALTPLFNQSVSQKTTIIRVTRDIKADDTITKDMIQAVEVGGYNLPEDVIRKQAISVSIKNFAGGLSGKLISGDIVSVIAPDYKKQRLTVILSSLGTMF